MKIRKSEAMDSAGSIEDKLIRLPKALRDYYGFEVGEFVSIGDLILQVSHAYFEDCHKQTAYVTTATFDILDLHNESLQEQELIPVDDITVGCDPEFFLVNRMQQNIVNPSRYFKKWDRVGYDGMLGELRPQYHNDPWQVVSNLNAMIMQAKDKIDSTGSPEVSLFASSSGFNLTAGFHCHLGIPEKFLNRRRLNYKSIIAFVVKALDYHVGTLAVIPEGWEDSSRRCFPFVSYGKVSDHRVDNRTLEYRVPGGALLRTPTLAGGLLSLCKLVCTDALSKVLTLEQENKKLYSTEDYIQHIYPYIPDTSTLYKLICSPTTTNAEKEVPKIGDALAHMYNYDEYSRSIRQYMAVMGEQAADKDIYFNWRNNNG